MLRSPDPSFISLFSPFLVKYARQAYQVHCHYAHAPRLPRLGGVP